MIISLIVAASTNNVIGKENQLPWHLPNDMKYFKNTTWGMPVIMGRKTFESMNGQPLPGRINIVVSRTVKMEADAVATCTSIQDALFVAAETDCKEAFIIGGGEIFKEIMPKANRLYMTRVHTIAEGDVFFPEIDEEKWKLVSKKDCYKDSKHAFDYSFEVWERI